MLCEQIAGWVAVWRRYCNRYPFSAFRSFEQPQETYLKIFRRYMAIMRDICATKNRSALLMKWRNSSGTTQPAFLPASYLRRELALSDF